MEHKEETIPMKICIWENIASPHQRYFFEQLSQHWAIDLQVRYFEKFHDERKDLGWSDMQALPFYEQYVISDINEALSSIPDWKERIHVIPGLSYDFTQKLLTKLIEHNIRWIHWSERSGIGLAKKLGFNVKLFKLLQPIVAKMIKYTYAKKINKYALGAFAQGYLAKQDFLDWGIKAPLIEYLYYTTAKMKRPDALPEELKKLDSCNLFLYAGSLSKAKGIVVLMEAFAKLKNADHWRLVLVGQDLSGGEWVQRTKTYKIEEKVIFTGVKPIERIHEYIGAADVFILPTLYDGWGAVLNEAAALGKPLISTDQCGSAYHLIKEKENGYRVAAGDIQALVNAMQSYIDHPERVQVHGRNSEKIYHDEFTPEKNVQRFLDALQKWQR